MPGKWPDVFYLAGVLNLHNGKEPSYEWHSVNQNLLHGDM